MNFSRGETDVLMFLKHFHRPKWKKLIFSFFISINRDSTERHVRLKIFHQWLLVVGIFSDASFRLRYVPRFHSVFSAAEASPLWRSGTSFASHAMGLRFEPGRVRSCIFVFCFFFIWFRLWATFFQNRVLICHTRNT